MGSKYDTRCPDCESHTGDGRKCRDCRIMDAMGIRNGSHARDRERRRERRALETVGLWF